MKLLSIIVPSYNMEKYLPKCLGSLVVAPELMERLEVLVVNDGSEDRTSEIAHDFEAKWPGVFKVIDKENGHYGSCVNVALPMTMGKYIKILDADDFVEKDEFASALRMLDEIDSDLVITDYRHVGRAGEVSVESKYPFDSRENFAMENLGEGISFLPIHAIAYHRRVFDGWNYHQLEGLAYTDCQWVSEPMLRVKSVRFLPFAVTNYLVGREGQTTEPTLRVENLEQQMAVDLFLAKLHAGGRPEWCNPGAWAYFERLLFREIAWVYRVAVLGVEGCCPPFDFGGLFDAKLHEVDEGVWESVAGHPEVILRRGKRMSFNCVTVWRRGRRARYVVPAIRAAKKFLAVKRCRDGERGSGL